MIYSEQSKNEEWETDRVLSGTTGPFGSASDISPDVWGEEFDAINAEKLVNELEQQRLQRLYRLGVPGVKTPDEIE